MNTTEAQKLIAAKVVELAGGRRRWVRIAEVGEELVGTDLEAQVIDDATFEAAIREMDLSRTAWVIPEENRKVITDLDRFWAVEIGRKMNHLIYIC